MPALIYQLLWQRALFTMFGINVEAVTLVVAGFLMGLGFGSFFGGWLFDQDGTQATFHGCVLFNGSIFLWGCGADAAESATGQGRLENACSVNAAISSTAE